VSEVRAFLANATRHEAVPASSAWESGRTSDASPYVFDYRGQFGFAKAPAVIWAAIDQTECFQSWWAWLTEFHIDGPGLRQGSVLEAVISPPLPYRMRVRVVLGECVPPSRVDAIVSGDLVGRASLLLEPNDAGTTASVNWTLEMRQLRMRLAARVAPGVLRWGHDRVVASTVAGLRRHLGEANGRLQ
jgi:hypothetical protein